MYEQFKKRDSWLEMMGKKSISEDSSKRERTTREGDSRVKTEPSPDVEAVRSDRVKKERNGDSRDRSEHRERKGDRYKREERRKSPSPPPRYDNRLPIYDLFMTIVIR
jgi:hypothetical protein